MKASDLLSIWEAPDNTRLTPKQISLRLPVHVSARISALCEMFPNKTRTEIIGDLLASALDQLQESFPKVKGNRCDEPEYNENGEPYFVYEDIGPTNRFRYLSNKYFMELEKELGNDNPSELFPSRSTVSEDEG